MRMLTLILLTITASCWVSAAAEVRPDGGITNGQVDVAAVSAAGFCSGLRVTAGERQVAVIRLGPRDLIGAARVTTERRGNRVSLRLSEIDAPRAGIRFAADSFVAVEVIDGVPWPRISFALGLDAFDQAAWQTAVGGTLPFHYLLCDLPDATLFYQGGGMIPLPAVDPFPFTATGFMAGEWAAGWSYAPALAAWAVPAVGLWNHSAKTLVVYDFNEQRHTDRSGEFVASAGCTGNGGAPFYCLVHPYQQQWVKLAYPPIPSRVASHFDLLYSFDLPAAKDPNQFVLERLWRERRALLPPVPRMNDLAWIPEYDGFTPGGGIEPTAAGIGLVWLSGAAGLEGTFVEPGTKMLGNDFIADGILRAQTLRPAEPLEPLRRDVEDLLERCTWVTVDGERCATWLHPIEGRFREEWGGARCAGTHHPSTFQIGTGLLRLYQTSAEPRLLPTIDGVYRWCRHYLFTRNGVCDLPWAMFSREATAVGEGFLLVYRQVFQDDPERRGHAAEALEMARTAVYKNLWFYTADPDPSDDLDPTFLNQATNDSRWAGRVTWNEAGWVLRTMVPVFCETGDPFLKYLLRGSAERYYAGFRTDGGIAENLQIFGEIEAKGLRTGGFPDAQHGGNLRRWARPISPATLRVAMGQSAALAFCLGTRSYDVEAYRYAAAGGFSFRLVGLPSAPHGQAIALVATAPFRDLRGKAISVNGRPLPAERYEFNPATAGEDVFIQGIQVGDVVQIGAEATGAVLESAGIPIRNTLPPTAAPWQTVDLGPAANTALPRGWWQEGSWYGLAPGRREAWGIPVDLVDPEVSGGKDALVQGSVVLGQRAGALFAVLGRLRGETGATTHLVATLRLEIDGAAPRVVEVAADTPFDLSNGFPLRGFGTYLAAVDLEGAQTVRSLGVEGGTLLALTLGDGQAPEVRQALARAAASRSQILAARTQRTYQAPTAACVAERPWAPGAGQPWRFGLTVLPSATARVNALVRAREDFAQLLGQVGLTGQVVAASLAAVETSAGAALSPVPVQFDPLPDGDGQRGELLLLMPGTTAAGVTRSFDVYCGPTPLPSAPPALLPRLSAERVTVDTGRGGLQFEFALDGAKGQPRWTRLAFDLDGDGLVEPDANLLGASGFNGGLADLTTCTDRVTWYDFGGLQSQPARAEVVHAGAVATTLRVSGLELWGQGAREVLGTQADGTIVGAAPVGEADWFFRFYPGRPVVEQWLDYRLQSLTHGWTRPLQVRYGLRTWETSGMRLLGGRWLAGADDVGVVPLAEETGTYAPQCMFTADGQVLQVAFNKPDALGAYFTGRWLVIPARSTEADYLAVAGDVALEQSAIEARGEGRGMRTTPTPMQAMEFDRSAGRGPGPRPPTREVTAAEGNLNPDPSFERQEAFWALGAGDTEARWTSTQVYSGKVALDLSCTATTLAIVSTNARASRALDVAPNGLYEVSFQAKCTSGEGEIQTNFYAAEPGCDFEHIIVPVPADGEWHSIRVEVPVGGFRRPDRPAGVFARSQAVLPALRLWTYCKAQATYVDQVEVRRLH